MASGTETSVIRLGDFQDGQEAECFAMLASKDRGTTKKNEPFVKCFFRDRHLTVEAPLWADSRFLKQSDGWSEGLAYRIRARGRFNARYGLQLELIDIRPAGGPDDEADGFDIGTLVERSKYPRGDRLSKILEFVDRYIEDEKLAALVRRILEAHESALELMPAASIMHHNVTGGLVEHLWSVTRVSIMLADHYGRYYEELNPPLNREVVVAAAILHDIGKLRELEYHPIEAKYTTEGNLIGHILMGRDLVRDTAREIGDFPVETLLLLEHAILAHHGKTEFGSPKAPATLEAMILHYADELDAKFNAVAKVLRTADGEEPFTSKIWAVENRRFYRGTPLPLPDQDQPPF
jgi:3'-5' exoribonuclease